MVQRAESGRIVPGISPKGKNKMFGSTLTDEEKAAKKAAKAEARRIRAEQDAERRAERAEAEAERFKNMPVFIVRETREVRVKAEDMQDAIALANAAFKEGQDEDDWGIKWHKPFGVDGDTIDRIRTVNVKAIEED